MIGQHTTAIFLTTLILSGCMGSDIDCGSNHSMSVLESLKKQILDEQLPGWVMSYIDDVEYDKPVTRESNDNAGLNHCEMNILVTAKNGKQSLVKVNYTNEMNGENTITNIRKDALIELANTMTSITIDDHHKDVATAEGFKNYQDYTRYHDAQNIVANYPAILDAQKHQLAALERELVRVTSILLPEQNALREGASIIRNNAYIQLKPTRINKKSVDTDLYTPNADGAHWVRFLGEIQNLSDIALTRVVLNATLYVDSQSEPLGEINYAHIPLERPILPGEIERVEIIAALLQDELDYAELPQFRSARDVRLDLRVTDVIDIYDNRHELIPVDLEVQHLALVDEVQTLKETISTNKALLKEAIADVAHLEPIDMTVKRVGEI